MSFTIALLISVIGMLAGGIAFIISILKETAEIENKNNPY